WMTYALPRSFDANRVLLSLQYLLSTDFTAVPPAENIFEKIGRQRLLNAELRLIRRCRHFRVLSDDMANSLKKLHPSAQIHVIPLAINAHAYQFAPRPQGQISPVLSVIGSMYWPPTQSAARRMLTRLWPAIHQAIPSARLQIVGRQAMSFFAEFQGQNNVEIHENVPDIEPYFLGSNALVYAPSAGSGMKVKVLEAMLQGLPVVTNRSGIEGLRVKHGRDCLIAETDDEFIRLTIELLNNPAMAQAIASHARTVIEEQCRPELIYEQLRRVYHTIGGSPSPIL
ncbi:MAG: glycosyltransferase family 4 protein, partial [bacterium]